MGNDVVIFVAIFGAATGLVLLVWYLISTRLGKRREALDKRMNGADSEPTLLLTEQAAQPRGLFGQLDASFNAMIARTGLDLEPPLALAIIMFFGIGLAILVFIWRFDQEPWLAVPALFLGGAIPLAFFLFRQGTWRRSLQEQLPDAIFLLARSMRAGRSFEQSIQLIGEHGTMPIRREFARMHHQLDLGLATHQVLDAEARRLQILDFNVFASVMNLYRTTGGNLPVILDRLAASIRDNNQFAGKHRAATVLGRYSAGFIGFMVVVILVWLFFFQRDWANNFFESPTGWALFLTAMALQVAGLALLYWFVKVAD